MRSGDELGEYGSQNRSPFCGVLLHGLPLLVVAWHFPGLMLCALTRHDVDIDLRGSCARRQLRIAARSVVVGHLLVDENRGDRVADGEPLSACGARPGASQASSVGPTAPKSSPPPRARLTFILAIVSSLHLVPRRHRALTRRDHACYRHSICAVRVASCRKRSRRSVASFCARSRTPIAESGRTPES